MKILNFARLQEKILTRFFQKEILKLRSEGLNHAVKRRELFYLYYTRFLAYFITITASTVAITQTAFNFSCPVADITNTKYFDCQLIKGNPATSSLL